MTFEVPGCGGFSRPAAARIGYSLLGTGVAATRLAPDMSYWSFLRVLWNREGGGLVDGLGTNQPISDT